MSSKCTCRVKEGFVAVPERTVGGQVIPAANIFYKMVGTTRRGKPTLFFIPGFGNNHETWKCQQDRLCHDFLTV